MKKREKKSERRWEQSDGEKPSSLQIDRDNLMDTDRTHVFTILF